MNNYNVPVTSNHVPVPNNSSHTSAPKPDTFYRPDPVVNQAITAPIRSYEPVVVKLPFTPSENQKIQNYQKPTARAPEPELPKASKFNDLTFEKLQHTFEHKRGGANEIPTANQARLFYRQQKQDFPTPNDIAETVHSTIQKDKDELRTMVIRQKHQVDQELASQVLQHQSIEKFNKDWERNMHNANPGFEFEWYSRYPRMQEFNKQVRQIQKEQTSEVAERKQTELAEYKKASSSILKPEEYQHEIDVSKQELFDAKKSIQSDLKTEYDHTTHAHQYKAQSEHLQNLHEEQAKIESNRVFADNQNHIAAELKQQRRAEMNSTLSSINEKKYIEHSIKINDRSNQQISEALDSEKNRLKDDLANERHKQTQEYAHDLSTHTHYNKERRTREQRDRKTQHKGLEFE
jgi:hypothetical protein